MVDKIVGGRWYRSVREDVRAAKVGDSDQRHLQVRPGEVHAPNARISRGSE